MDKWKEETYYFLESQIKQTLAFISRDCNEIPYGIVKSLQDMLKLMTKAQMALKNYEC